MTVTINEKENCYLNNNKLKKKKKNIRLTLTFILM